MAAEDSSTIVDIKIGDEKVGWTYDGTPPTINSDQECKLCLDRLKSDLPLTPKENKLIDQCIAVVSAEEGDDVVFGPYEILKLAQMALKYRVRGNDIMGCSHHLVESLDFEGILPEGGYLGAAEAHLALGDALTMAMEDSEEDYTDSSEELFEDESDSSESD